MRGKPDPRRRATQGPDGEKAYNLEVDLRIFYHAQRSLVPKMSPECKFGRFGQEDEGCAGIKFVAFRQELGPLSCLA
jgi:hypothetical protein